MVTRSGTLKRQLAAVAVKLEGHYRTCLECGSAPHPCARGGQLWERASRLHADIIRVCVQWHAVHATGPARATLLLSKLRRIAEAISAAERPLRQRRSP
jgi:hypothetical protein